MNPYKSIDQIADALKPNPTQAGKRLQIPKASLSKFLNGDTMLADKHASSLARELHTSSETLEELFLNKRNSIRLGHLNETGSEPSKDAKCRMLEQERKEFVAAIQWMVERLDSEKHLEELHKEVWGAKLSAAAKHIVLSAVLQEQEKRTSTTNSSN